MASAGLRPPIAGVSLLDTLAPVSVALAGILGVLTIRRSCSGRQNPCAAFTCQNGGSCLVEFSGWAAKCCCSTGYTGVYCETVVNACTNNPCNNGGTCTVGSSGEAQCACAVGFAGSLCEVDCTASVTCPSGLEKITVSGIERCYLISTTNIESWAAAVKTCSDQGLILWEPNTNDEVTTVAALLASGNYWVGVSDVTQEGSVIFSSSGESFTLTTTGNTVVKDCLEFIKSSTTFEFRACYTSTRRYVCEQQTECA